MVGTADPTLQHRAEVDGARAIAVIPVLGFHAGFAGLRGGYVGVDVFFVISGYLITRILLRDIGQGDFSYVGFLERRIRRILPALYVVMLACIPLGWCTMLADGFENFGQSLVATSLSCNNLLLWLTSGYWAGAVDFKPLMHTWSLGVEEQFYLGYPILLAACMKWTPRAVPWMMAVLILGSLASAQAAFGTHPKAVFLLLPFRVFELMAGAMVAWAESRARDTESWRPPIRSRALREALAAGGLIAIALACVMLDERSSVPGLAALLPVGGAVSVLACARHDTAVGRFLGLAPLVAIGTVSYSLYLWHQPMLAFFRLASPDEPTGPQLALVTVATLPVAWASWRWIETPFRRRSWISRRGTFTMGIVGGAALLTVGLAIDRWSGFPSRVPGMPADRGAAGRQMTQRMYVDRMFEFVDRELSDPDRLGVLVLGNSYARDFLNCMIENRAMQGCEVSYVPVDLPAIASCMRDGTGVPDRVRRRLAHAKVLILVQGDVAIFDPECHESDFAAFRELGPQRIIVVGTKNFGRNPDAIMSMNAQRRHEYRARVTDEAWERNERDAAAFPKESFVDLMAMLADGDRRVSLFSPDGELLTEDGGHLTRAGARHVGALLFGHPLLKDLP